jgi:hypothetical protein
MTGKVGSGPPIRRVLDVLKIAGGPDGSGEYLAFCPAHDDRKTPNLRIREAEDGRVLLRCFAGCGQNEVLSALTEKGIGKSDLFAKHDRGGELLPPGITYTPARSKPMLGPSVYRSSSWLGLSDTSYVGKPAVRVTYLKEDGSEGAVRFRIALDKGPKGDERFRWRKGSKPSLYGLWRLEHAREKGCIFMVEGESDAQTLWHHGLPALGVSDAGTWRGEWAEHLKGIEKVYAVVEPDRGGEAFWQRLAASALREKLYRVELEGAGDVSELHLQDPDDFPKRIEEARSCAAAWLDIAESEAQERAREAWSACERLAHSPEVLDQFAREIGRRVSGEVRTAKLLYPALTSRVLERPVSVAVKGPSSGGKTYLVERVLDFFPDGAYHALTAMSDRALAYSEEPIKHRILVFFEAEGMASDFATYLMRSLLSEGRLRYEFVEKTSEGLRVRLIEREGPTGLIVTTTAVRMHPENETRLLSLTVTDTREQTRDILASLAKSKTEGTDLTPWHALQEWLASPAAERKVAIPYAPALAELVPPVAVRLRRDFGAVLNLIQTHVILHQASRERNEEGHIVATLDDYARVRDLVDDLISEGIEATVPQSVREVVEAAVQLHEEEDEPVTTAALARELKLDRTAASRRVRSAKDRGYLRDLEDNPANPPASSPEIPCRRSYRSCPPPRRSPRRARVQCKPRR